MSLRMLARLDLLMEPLRISSAICSAGSLLMEFISLSTPYWVLESTKKGMVHSGLWTICVGPNCTMYWFNLLATHIHFTRAFLVIACFCSLFSLLCVCISFERDLLFNISLLRAAATFSLMSALLILIGMAIFTYVQRHSQPYTNYSLVFGSSYGLGWASIPMHVVTGFIHVTRVSVLFGMIAGAVSCIGLCGTLFGFQLGSISKAKTSTIASIVAAGCVLIAMVAYTGVGSMTSYRWSFGLAWASFPLFLITGSSSKLHRAVADLTIPTMQALQIGTVVCAFISLLFLLIALGSDYWLANAISHSGLWKACLYALVVTSCASYGMDVNASMHATRAFMFFGMIAGAISCVGLCGKIFGFQVGSISKAKTSAIASIVAAVCVLIAMATFTGRAGSNARYGWSFGLGWASVPLFLITGGLTYHLSTAG